MTFAMMRKQLAEDYDVHGRSLRNRGLWAMALYRFGQWALSMRPGPVRWGADKVYGVCSIFMPILTGVSIDRRMRVGRRFHLIHPGMVCIHPDVVFGDRCGVMHNVTFGTNIRGEDGVPRVGDDVFVGPGAVVLGKITIGDGAWIAANSLVISNVPPGALAIGVPAKMIPSRVWRGEPAAEKGEGSDVICKASEAGEAAVNGQRADKTRGKGQFVQ